MSQNLIGIVKEYKGKYYVFPEPAEELVSDERSNGDKVRYLEITNPTTLGPYSSLEEVYKRAEFDFSMGYFEYGLSCSDWIDDVKLITTYNGKAVDEEKA